MQERRVTVDGVSLAVPTPFMVIATQNPIEQAGTYRLPEAQLDRFMLKSSIGYPDHATLVDILSQEREIDASELDWWVTTAEIDALQTVVDKVHAAPAIVDDRREAGGASRRAEEVRLGVSVRGAKAFLRAAKSYAAIDGRDFVTPDDVKALALPRSRTGSCWCRGRVRRRHARGHRAADRARGEASEGARIGVHQIRQAFKALTGWGWALVATALVGPLAAWLLGWQELLRLRVGAIVLLV